MKASKVTATAMQQHALGSIADAATFSFRNKRPARLTRRQMKAAKRIERFRTHERLLKLHAADIQQMNDERQSDDWKRANSGNLTDFEKQRLRAEHGRLFGFPKFALAPTINAISQYRQRPDAYMLARISPSDEQAAGAYILRKDIEAQLAQSRHGRRVQREHATRRAIRAAQSEAENHGAAGTTTRLVGGRHAT